MRLKIDLKSALAGLCLGLLATIAIGAGSVSNPVGKYKVAGTASYFVIIDTTTGQAWCANFISNNRATDPEFFQPKP